MLLAIAGSTAKAQVSAISGLSPAAGAFCLGSPVTLKATSLNAATIIWQRYKGQTATGTATPIAGNTPALSDATITVPGYYTYVATGVNADGCTSVVSDPIVVYVLPDITATIAANVDAAHQHYCTTDVPTGTNAIVLTATGTNTQTGLSETFAYNYQWFKDGVAIATNGTSATYTLTAPFDAAVGPKAYTVQLTYIIAPTCTAATSTSITITVNDVPGKPTIVITP